MSKHTIKPSSTFWKVAIIAFIWNLLGVLYFLGQTIMPNEIIAVLPKEQSTLFHNAPAWVTVAFAIAVWGGLLGCILLLLRKYSAKRVFVISFLGIIVYLIYHFFITKASYFYDITSLIIPILTVIIGIYLIGHSNRCIREGILN
jgi:hypothetical protein